MGTKSTRSIAMGQNSTYYREKEKAKRDNIKQIKNMLPQHTHGFIEECLLKYQINTVYSYVHDLLVFYKYLKKSNPLLNDKELKDISLDDLSNLNASDINEFQNNLAIPDEENGLRGSRSRAVARKMASVRNFFKYLERMDIIDHDPTKKAAKKKKEIENEIFRLDQDEVKHLIQSVSDTDVQSYHSKVMSEITAKRDLAIIVLLLGTGIRVSECAGIDLDDVNFNTNTISIIRKGGRSTDIYISEQVRNTLKDYINNERESLLNGEDEPALFISLKHRRLSVRSIQYMVEKYGNNLGLTNKLSPHKLRKTYGTALYNKTGDIYMVADVLGHKDVTTTVKHYAAMEKEHKQKAAQIDIYDME